jgi:hypothetical protein
MYMFPKFLEALPTVAAKHKRDHLLSFKYGRNAMLAFSLAITTHLYNRNPECIKTSMKFVLDLIIGKDESEAASKAKESKEETINSLGKQLKPEEYLAVDENVVDKPTKPTV